MLEKIKTKNLRVALLKEGVGVKCGGGWGEKGRRKSGEGGAFNI
jgi:hypothetical protein